MVRKPMKKIGIILPSLTTSQQSYLTISRINEMALNQPGYDYIIFSQTIDQPCMKPACAIMNIGEIWSFDGLLISTTLYNTQMSASAVNNAKKVFYVWDLEWLRQSKDYIENLYTYRNENINLVCRSQEHSDMVKNYSNRRPDAIIEDFNLRKIIDEFYRDIR